MTTQATAFTAIDRDVQSDAVSDEFDGFSETESDNQQEEDKRRVLEKDDEELELEELLFGANSAFRSEIGSFARSVIGDEEHDDESAKERDEKGLQHLSDDQVRPRKGDFIQQD